MNKIYRIYFLKNKVNGKGYIGFTHKSIEERLQEHIYRATSKNSKKRIIHNAILKYGSENFTIETLYESMDKDHTLNIMEPYFIAKYNSEYNMTKGGESVVTLNEEQKQRKIEKFKNTIAKKYENGYINPRLGATQSQSVKDKLSLERTGKYFHCKTYLVTFPSGETIVVKNLMEFCRKYNLTPPGMYVTAQGKQTHHKHFRVKQLFNELENSGN